MKTLAVKNSGFIKPTGCHCLCYVNVSYCLARYQCHSLKFLKFFRICVTVASEDVSYGIRNVKLNSKFPQTVRSLCDMFVFSSFFNCLIASPFRHLYFDGSILALFVI